MSLSSMAIVEKHLILTAQTPITVSANLVLQVLAAKDEMSSNVLEMTFRTQSVPSPANSDKVCQCYCLNILCVFSYGELFMLILYRETL